MASSHCDSRMSEEISEMNEQIAITNTLQLLEKLRFQELEVEWTVTSDIGPEWIGSSTEINFYFGNCSLTRNEFLQSFENALKEAMTLPEIGGERIISGEGIIFTENDELKIKFQWFSCLPYMDPDEHGNGEAVIYA